MSDIITSIKFIITFNIKINIKRGPYNKFLLINNNEKKDDKSITKRWPAVKLAVILIPKIIVLNIYCVISTSGRNILKINGVLKSIDLFMCFIPMKNEIGIVINIEVIIVKIIKDNVSITLIGLNGKLAIIIKNGI